MKSRILIILLIAGLAFGACRKPYNPAPISTNANYLVVEGVVNSGADSTIIKLSRTVSLSEKTTLQPEQHAIVTVESDVNTSYALTEIKKGQYAALGLNLDNSRKYRLSIKTSNNQQFQSDYVPVVNAPPVDSLYYQIEDNGINIYANTHDPKNSTHYYRWDFNETWQFHSLIKSNFKSDGDTVTQRNFLTDDIWNCWQSDTSSTITLGNSAKLSSDVIYKQPISFVASTSIKLETGYSILVNQYALTNDAYNFWQNLKNNTEKLGSIFDALPTQVNGHIHCTSNAATPVIGYVSVGAVTHKRILIHTRDLPAWLPTQSIGDIADSCGVMACLYAYTAPGSGVTTNQVDQFINYKKSGNKNPLIPIMEIALQLPTSSPIIGYVAGLPKCIDCTLTGTNKIPPYWTF